MLTPDTPDALDAQEEMLRAALGVLRAERGREDDPHFGDELDLAHERMAYAARALHEAIEALPRDERPVGWNEKERRPKGGRLNVSFSRDELDLIIDALGNGSTDTYGKLRAKMGQERRAFDRHPEPERSNGQDGPGGGERR